MKTKFLIAAAIAALAVSCASAPKEIPQELTAREIVQRAQEASDQYNYKAATAYYRALLDRFGSDPSIACAAEYEISLIDYKLKRYDEARSGFESLLKRYEGEGAATLPPRYSVLAKKMLERIAETEKKKPAKPASGPAPGSGPA
jgi:outer membrane protein assembly factor BamD (BamD/ComL family)